LGRPENYLVGAEGEERIKAILYVYGCEIEETDDPNGYPDFYFVKDGIKWAVESKTMKGVHTGGKTGMAKITRTEYRGTDGLRQDNVRPCLIVEVRPRGFKAVNYPYFFVPWTAVEERFERSNPSQVSLSLWWVLENGVNLRWWLNER